MEDEEKVDPGSSSLGTVSLLLIAAGPLYIILSFFYKTYQFFLKPDVLVRSLEMSLGMLLCFGAWSLFIWLFLMIPPSLFPGLTEDDVYQETSRWYQKLWMSPIVLLVILWISIAPLFMLVAAFCDNFIAPQIERLTSKYRDGRSE